MISRVLCSILILTLLQGRLADCSSGKESPCGEAGQVDAACVRTYFSEHTGAAAVEAADGLDPYDGASMFLYPLKFNITLIKPTSTFTGFSNSVIEKFEVDFDNNVTAVLVRHPRVDVSGPMYIYFHYPGNASLAVLTKFFDEYYETLTTTLFTGTENTIDLSRRQTHFFQTVQAYLSFGDDNLTAAAALYPFVRATVTALGEDFYTVGQEVMYSMAKTFSDAYLGKNVITLPDAEALFQSYVL